MNTLYLLRHSLTRANEAHLYGGSTDLPLSPAGRALAEAVGRTCSLPDDALWLTSGMRRADETLSLMIGRAPDAALPQLREMDFGAFEMKSYDQLKDDPDYVRWITDDTGRTRCPGGECTADFKARVLAGGERLIRLEAETVVVVCHGGTIVNLMQAWFPREARTFYDWQPKACRGYRISFENGYPTAYESIG